MLLILDLLMRWERTNNHMARKNTVTVGKVMDIFLDQLEVSKKYEFVRKPISHALYVAWQWSDAHERPRGNENEK